LMAPERSAGVLCSRVKINKLVLDLGILD
jgi:hypothetical protein